MLEAIKYDFDSLSFHRYLLLPSEKLMDLGNLTVAALTIGQFLTEKKFLLYSYL